MSFLDNTGLAYFYSKLKEKFIQTVNGSTPDSNGNVQINQVPLAENLTSPDAQASIDTFIYRTSGGSASLESGEANLVFVNGNMEILGRVAESWSAETTGGISCNVDNITKSQWRNQVSTNATVPFTYSVTIASGATTNWTSNGSWSPLLSDYGMDTNVISEVKNYSISCNVSGAGITGATVDPATFATSTFGANTGTYTFVYHEEVQPETEGESVQEAGWYYNSNLISDLSTYGIATTVTTSTEDDSITISWTVGTANGSQVIITYVAPVQGTLNVAKPTAFQSTGFNQFDKNTMIISGATINRISGTIIGNTGTTVCYCPAVGGDHGYAAVSIGEHINTTGGMGWCAEKPVLGSSVVTQSENVSDATSKYSARFTASEDGYMIVVVDDPTDLMMGCAWSDYISDIQEINEYVAYVPPSQIPIPMYGYDDEGQRVQLPTKSYGLPRLGSVYDTINFDASTYIKRIGQMAYNDGNLTTVQYWYNTDGTPYDYDSTNIFYVLDGNLGRETATYNLETSGSYTSSSGAVTAVDFDKFVNSGLPYLFDYDPILHDSYTFTATSTNNVWSYTWNDGTSHTQNFLFDSNWGITFGSVSADDTLTIYIPIDSIYQVDDHGTEKFTGTTIPIEAELLYGQNLRDKLRTDVLTISEQTLTVSQIKQIWKNLGLNAFTNYNTSSRTLYAANWTETESGSGVFTQPLAWPSSGTNTSNCILKWNSTLTTAMQNDGVTNVYLTNTTNNELYATCVGGPLSSNIAIGILLSNTST